MVKKIICVLFTFLISIVFISCETKKSNLEESVYYVENIKPIQDSIFKLKTYGAKLAVCSLKKTSSHTIINLSVPDTPYKIHTNYKYKKIQGVNILFVNYDEKLINQEIPKQLIKDKILAFNGPENNEPPYLEFIFCPNDISSIKCFNNIQLDDFDQEFRKNKKIFNEDMLVRKCDDNET
ncbi:hypothetical protein [Flavobacterium sp. UBA7680]|uniref:hypothetical protein n=1 Tax=Flavobacterium sp. UBA7680 TaxID=1946559 RepID=UPI0025BA97BB|nr:hypothetical protein [Flavobacterium sp. UBA7680]